MAVSVTVHRLSDCRHDDALISGIEEVFFSSSNVQSFTDGDDRLRFRERWLGRYLTHFPEWALIARSDDGVAGYLVGADIDPARSPHFADIEYFAAFAALTATFPAHLHVNVAERYRGSGLGSRLIETFVDRLRREGSPGVHVITGKGARNVEFYMRNGFVELGTTGAPPRELSLLARAL